MALLERDWDTIRRALLLTASLASAYGLSGQNLRAISALLPVAYYMFKVNATESLLTHTKHSAERSAIRHWLIASLLKPSGIWGSGLDTLLTALREIIRVSNVNGFPAAELRVAMEARGKSLSFGESEIERLADASYGGSSTFLLLTLLYPHVDLRNKFHVDHIFPTSLLSSTSLRKSGVAEADVIWFQTRKDLLANLQLMDGAENLEKRAKLPEEWIHLRYPEEIHRKHYLNLYDIDDASLENLVDFREFYEQRRLKLVKRIKTVLNG